MHKILILLFLLPVYSFSQNCSLQKTKDQFSQEPKLTTGFMALTNSQLSIDATMKEIDFFFTLKNKQEQCFDDNSTITFVFEGKGNLKSNFKNSGTMNCDGLVHVTFKNSVTTPSTLTRLTTKKITAISIVGSNGKATTLTLSDAQQKQLMEMISCLVNEAKTLIK